MSDSEYDEWGEGVMLTVMKMVVKMVDDYNSVILLTLFGPGGAHCVFLAKKNGQHEEDLRYHIGSNFSLSTKQI